MPADVDQAFTTPELEDETKDAIDSALTAQRRGQLFDAPPIEPDPDVETNDDEKRPVDELF